MAYKPKEFVVNAAEDFEDMVAAKDFRIAESIVEGILANLSTKKQHVHLLSVVCTDENSVYDITVDRKYFITTLEENIAHYVREEKYEDCQRIANAIELLKNQEVFNIVNQVSQSKK